LRRGSGDWRVGAGHCEEEQGHGCYAYHYA
jgi:hypothetical protein